MAEEQKIDNTADNTAKKVPGKPFAKGEDPRRNLDGRPKGSFSLKTLLEKEIQEVPDGQKLSYAMILIKQQLAQAIKDKDTATQKLIWNYLEGLPRQQLDIGADKESLSELTEFFRAMAGHKKDD